MEDIMEIDKSVEESGLLIKDVSEFKYISLLGNPLTNKELIRAWEEEITTSWLGRGTNKVGQNS